MLNPSTEQVPASRLDSQLWVSNKPQQIKKMILDPQHLSALPTRSEQIVPLHQTGGDKVRGQVDTLFKVLDIMNLNTRVQASVLLSQR